MLRHPRRVIAAIAVALSALPSGAETPDPTDWTAVLDQAAGQTVYWHAWGGSSATNAFIGWVGEQVADAYEVTLAHVKLADTAEAVGRVLAEKQAGRDRGGAVDLIWINGPNFAQMKDQGLLFGPFAEALPNWRYVDVGGKPVRHDFTVPTEGFEAPWATAQVVFMHDTRDLPDRLGSAEAILAWATANPGRFTYPRPPDFLGVTFLKQMLVELVPDPGVLQRPVEEADYAATTAPLWGFLQALTPALWRAGRAYPATGPDQLRLIADDEIDLAISFSPGEASTAIADHRLPPTVRTFVLDAGTLGNASFVAIPYNASAKAGAMVVANFLMSPQAQLHAQDPDILGYGTVLSMAALSPDQAAAFAELDLGVATLSPEALGPVRPEPHPSWTERIAADWEARYGIGR